MVGAGPRLTILKHEFGAAEPPEPSANTDLVQITGDYQTLEGVTLDSASTFLDEPGSGVGIRIRRQAGSQDLVFRVCVRDCEILEPQTWGVCVDDAPREGRPQFAVWAFFDRIEVFGSRYAGAVRIGNITTTQYFTNCYFRYWHTGPGVVAQGASGLSFLNCIFEKGYVGPYLDLDSCGSVLVQHCWFEGRLGASAPYIRATGHYTGLTVDSCTFGENDGDPSVNNNLRAIQLMGEGRAVAIRGCQLSVPHGLHADAAHPAIRIEPPVDPIGRPIEAIIEGVALRDAAGEQEPRIERSSRTVLLNTALRSSLTRFLPQGITQVPDPQPGDIGFNELQSVAQVFDGSAWRNLW